MDLRRAIVDSGQQSVLEGYPPPGHRIELAAVLQQRVKGVRLGTAMGRVNRSVEMP